MPHEHTYPWKRAELLIVLRGDGCPIAITEILTKNEILTHFLESYACAKMLIFKEFLNGIKIFLKLTSSLQMNK